MKLIEQIQNEVIREISKGNYTSWDEAVKANVYLHDAWEEVCKRIWIRAAEDQRRACGSKILWGQSLNEIENNVWSCPLVQLT